MILVVRQSVRVRKVMREVGKATAQVPKVSGARMVGKHAWGFGLPKTNYQITQHTHPFDLNTLPSWFRLVKRNFAEGCYKIVVKKQKHTARARSRRQIN